MYWRPMTALLLLSSAASPPAPARADDAPKAVAEAVARQILDDSKPDAEREALVETHAVLSDRLIEAMAAGLKPGTPDEYRRIPWIWRVAIAAGKRNEAGELARILGVALPTPGGKLDDWRAVVVGGGLINGVSQAGEWPGPRFEAVVKGDPGLSERWRRCIELAAAMADDEAVATGTRYDALRVIGVEPWDRRGAQLFRYLVRGIHPELQMGAISGLSDVQSPPAAVAQALASGLEHYAKPNLELALDALLRDEARASVLLDLLADGRLKADRLGEARVKVLKAHASEAVRTRAGKLLGADAK